MSACPTCPLLDRKIGELQAEVKKLRALVDGTPQSETIRHVAPFIEAALEAGVWEGPGAESVRTELAGALALLEEAGRAVG